MSIEAFNKLSDERREVIVKHGIEEFSRKSYSEASTDEITRSCGISKGILFHYFGNKETFYLYCLNAALERLVSKTSEPTKADFYGVIFSEFDEKLRLCGRYPDETRFVNMAARETSGAIAKEKGELIARYTALTNSESRRVMKKAMEKLKLKDDRNERVYDAVHIYASAIVNRYLALYKERPEAFFSEATRIKEEMREYLGFMLNGITETENEDE